MSGGLLGLAYPYFVAPNDPSCLTLDGVAIDYRTFPSGSDTYSNTGLNLLHEVGHWLGLFHTFHPNSLTIFGICPTDAQFTGDQVIDTPPEDCPALWYTKNFGYSCAQLAD